MNELIQQISEAFASFENEAKSQCEKSNKAAGCRARKQSLELEKLLKDFRKKSLDFSKA